MLYPLLAYSMVDEGRWLGSILFYPNMDEARDIFTICYSFLRSFVKAAKLNMGWEGFQFSGPVYIGFNVYLYLAPYPFQLLAPFSLSMSVEMIYIVAGRVYVRTCSK